MAALLLNSEKISDVELMIFDKDGTLIHLYNYWSNMIRYRSEKICHALELSKLHINKLMFEMGIDVENERLRPQGPVGVKPREIVLQTAVNYLNSIGKTDNYDLCVNIFKEVDELSQNKFNEIITPIPGCYELIANLKKAEIKIAIATTDRTDRAKLAIGFLGIADSIDIIIGADLVDKSKPAPDMANLICKELKISEEHTVMVGDSLTDLQMGLNAHLKASVGVCTGITSKENLLNITKYVVNSVADIKIA